MVMPLLGGGADPGALIGDSYGAVLVADVDAAAVVEALREIAFSGWIAPSEDGWVVAIGDPGGGVVAGARRGIVEAGAHVALRLGVRVIALRVRRDRELAIVAWRGDEEVIRYWSDPSQEPDADREVLSDPVGADDADALLDLVGRGADEKAAAELVEILEEELDTDSVIESERLRTVLDRLGLPTWIVAAPTLPRDLPTGPATSRMTRLRAGRPGVAGILLGVPAARWRRRRTPPPILADPPRGDTPNLEYWML